MPSGCGKIDTGPELFATTVFPLALNREKTPCGWISIRTRFPSASNTSVVMPDPEMSWYVIGNGQKPSSSTGFVVSASGERTFVSADAGDAPTRRSKAETRTMPSTRFRINAP